MKRFVRPIAILFIIGLLVVSQSPGHAQGLGPIVTMLGKPDSRSNPPNVNAYISVLDPNTGRSIPDLSDPNVSVQVSEEDKQATVTPETRGVALAMVIDRGGIARQGDPRIERAVDLADTLLSMLNVDGSPSTDMVSLIGIRGPDDGGLTPTVPFTDYDPNLIRNEFDGLRTEVVPETTPLYDGLDRAIEWLSNNPETELQAKIDQRQKLIVVFSDGIDNKFSSEAHETRIMDKCNQNGIIMYTVRMGGGTTDEDNMKVLAVQSHGLHVEHTPDTQPDVISMFENIVTQRQAYRITFDLYRPQGDYEATIQVLDTPIGDGSARAMVSSRLETPDLTLVPPPNLDVRVPYSSTQEGFLQTVISLQTQVNYPDGIVREPPEVAYFANGVRIGTSSAPPNYAFTWDVTELVTPTEEIQREAFTIVANTRDPYLENEIVSEEFDLQVTWERIPEPTWWEKLLEWATENWWLLLILSALTIGLVILLFMLIKTKGEIARTAVKRTTGAIKGMTQRLGVGGGAPARGKLVITKGANIGREFKLSTPIVKVGRDPQFSDFALYDQFVSNPHFSILMEQDQFYVQDEGSTNGTKLNGAPLQRGQRYPMQQDAIIEAGSTQIQFKRLGGTTRRLGASGGGGYQQQQQPYTQGGGSPGYAGPTQPAQPYGGSGQASGGAQQGSTQVAPGSQGGGGYNPNRP